MDSLNNTVKEAIRIIEEMNNPNEDNKKMKHPSVAKTNPAGLRSLLCETRARFESSSGLQI